MKLLPATNPIRRHFHFADSPKRKKQPQKIFWRFLRGLFRDISYRVGNRRLKRYSPDLHAREIHAHQRTWRKRTLHQHRLSLFQHPGFEKLFFGHQFYAHRRPVLGSLDASFAPLLRPTFRRNWGSCGTRHRSVASPQFPLPGAPLGGARFATRLLISAVILQRAACRKHQPGGGADDISSNQVCASKLYLPRHDWQVLQRTMRNDGRHPWDRMRLPTPRMRRPHGSQLASDRLEQASAPKSSVPMVKPAASPSVLNQKN